MKDEATIAAKAKPLTGCGRVRRLLLALSAAAAMAACCANARAQSQMGVPNGGGVPQATGPFIEGADEVDSMQTERRLNALNAERQKALAADTERLLKLATELNEQIAKSNTGALTLDQMHMLVEIEKLAHNVRDKMAMSLRGPQFPGLDGPMQPFLQPQHH